MIELSIDSSLIWYIAYAIVIAYLLRLQYVIHFKLRKHIDVLWKTIQDNNKAIDDNKSSQVAIMYNRGLYTLYGHIHSLERLSAELTSKKQKIPKYILDSLINEYKVYVTDTDTFFKQWSNIEKPSLVTISLANIKTLLNINEEINKEVADGV
jgi:hypothetical protein